MVFAKNEDGEILPQSRRAQRNATIAKGYVEANKNWQAYSDDLEVLKELNKQLDNNGQAITDNEQRMAKANEVTKNASQRAKDYGKQMATNTKTLTDFKRENEVEKPDQQKQGKWSDGLKSMASAGLSMIGNAFISAGVGMLVQGAFSLLGKGIDAFVHKNENLIAKGQEAKESIQSQTKAYEDQKASLGELTSKYTELSKGVKISGNSIKNISLTDDEYKDFLDTSNQIAAAAPSLTRSWDSQGNAKKVGPKEMQQLADILGISTPGVKKYDSWGSALKNQILQKYKSYGFATGGIINKLIPADMSTLLGKAIISNGDQGFIGAKVGESVMTEEFTRLLKPSIAAMNNFTNMFNPVTPTATNNDYTINNEVNINVANMSNDLDIQDVANKVSTIINKNMTRDWRKLR